MNSALAHTRGRRHFFKKNSKTAKTEIQKKSDNGKTAKKSGKTANFVPIGEKFVFFFVPIGENIVFFVPIGKKFAFFAPIFARNLHFLLKKW
jgi:hypothetical protein